MDTRTSYSRSSTTPSSGFRSQSWSRASPSSSISSSFKRTNVAVPRAYSSAVHSSSDSLDFSQSSALNGDYKRSNEKEQLQGLNDRFAGYIDKVHYLEQQNKEIEAEIQALRQKQVTPSQLGNVYDQELGELRAVLEQVNHEKAQIQLDTDHIEEDIHRLKDRYEEEVRVREDTEATIRAMKKDVEDSALVRVELDKRAQSLQDEIAFLKNNHEEEVGELLAQIQASQVTVERKDYLKTDITSALKEIRSQLEGHSSQNLQQAEDWFKCRYSKLTEAADQNKEAIKSARDEISEYRRQLQSKSIELESARGTKESLERQLNDIEDRHNSDLTSYQGPRKLLEGEETRFSSFSGGITGPSFPYRQPVPVTPAKIHKAKAEPPKLKVQHKFVEEIIEETKVEDEQSEMDMALAAVAEELAAEPAEEEAEEEGEEEQEEGAKEEEGQEAEEAVEEEVVAVSKAAVSASAPKAEAEEEEEEAAEEDEEEGEKEEGEEEEEAEKEEGEETLETAEAEEEEGEAEGEEKAEEEEEEAEGEKEEGEKEEESEAVVEEAIVEEKIESTKASKQEVKPEEEQKEASEGEEEKESEKEGEQEQTEEETAEDETKGEGKAESKEDSGEESEDKKEDEDETAEEEKESKEEAKEETVSKSEADKVGSEKKESKGEADEEAALDAAEKEDTAVNGEVVENAEEGSGGEEQDEEEKAVVTNGVDESPSAEDSSQKVVITKTVETITTTGDGDKQITKSVTVTQTMEEVEQVVEEKLVSTKKVEKVTSQSAACH
ncbi:UNVERIFIED_CONTAM: hypothetical protein FKN15_053598 [Acipenser sinensis]